MKAAYQGRTIDHLMRMYTFENFRTDKHDAAITKKQIRDELHRRVDVALLILEGMEDRGDVETDERVNRFYENQFLTGRL